MTSDLNKLAKEMKSLALEGRALSKAIDIDSDEEKKKEDSDYDFDFEDEQE
jgi:hypothetical protein